MSDRSRSRLPTALLGGAVLGAAMPGVLPNAIAGLAPLLVVPGLMAWFAIATCGARPRRSSYLFGCVFMALFSWSLHHVLVPAYLAVVVLGGLYFALGTAAVRGFARWPVLGFALAVAATFWLRANMPEIYYPHGQPAHAWFASPMLLGAVSLGGEPLANALLGALAAALVGVCRSWRLATPPLSSSLRQLLLVAAVAVVATVTGHWLRPSPTVTGSIAVAAVEPGLHPVEPYLGVDPERARVLYREQLEVRLLRPTRALFAGDDPPELVLWPETALPHELLPIEQLESGAVRIDVPGELPAAPGRLLLGVLIERAGRATPAAVLVDLPAGRVLGHNEKRRIVPGGEFLPFTRWLPKALGDALLAALADALGAVPDFGPGVAQPLLTTASGRRFGALMCYDNAFPEPARDLVDRGAEFLVVLSNEAWYRGGAELAQLAAMTVCRALELGVPIVRCTTDGWSLVVAADGRLGEQLEPMTAPTPGPRILRARLPLGPGPDRPMAWCQGLSGPLAAIWLLLAILHAALAWARLRVARNAA